jgi:hypothetical protein
LDLSLQVRAVFNAAICQRVGTDGVAANKMKLVSMAGLLKQRIQGFLESRGSYESK